MRLFLVLLVGIVTSGLAQAGSKMKFIENKGQWPGEVRYAADVPSGKLFVQQNSFTYVFYDPESGGHHHGHADNGGGISPAPSLHASKPDADTSEAKTHAFRINVVGGISTSIEASGVFTEHYNYYLGNDRSKWASGAKAYNQLLYPKIYPETDMKWYQANDALKYEFIVHPGGDPNKIQLKYEGVEDISIRNGMLVVKTSVNSIIEKAPYIYQVEGGIQKRIEGKFVLEESVVSFKIMGRYNKKLDLVIDPLLIFSTYSGSFADNWGNTAAYDTLGYMYSGGTVFGVGFPDDIGPGYRGGVDIGILKYLPNGSNVEYVTYLGGNNADVPYSLVVNSKNELLITGATGSNNFPVIGNSTSFQGGSNVTPVSGITFSSGSDLYVAKLDETGVIANGRYVGGNANDGIQITGEALTKNYGDQLRGDIVVDDQDNVYVVSNTRSANFPVSPGAYQPSLIAGKDGVVFKLSEDLSTLLWSTYLGGSGEDALYSIQVDSTYGVYVCGGTSSLNYPTTGGSIWPVALGGIDGVVSHISNDGISLLHSTFLSTSSYDQAYFVQLDTSGNVYVFGQTRGVYPVSANVYFNNLGGQFIHSMDGTLSLTRFSTTIGSGARQPNISPTAFLVNECGNIFLSGWGGWLNHFDLGYIQGFTDNMPVTSNAFRGTTDGSDFYIAVLSQNAADLLYGTYFGIVSGNSTNYSDAATYDHVDGGTSRFDKKGIIYEAVCAGCGGSDLFPTTPGAYSNVNNSVNCNNASFKFDLNNLIADFEVQKAIKCDSYKIEIENKTVGGQTFLWDFGDGQTSSSPNPGEHTYAGPGDYTIRLIVTDLTTCVGRDTVEKPVVVPPILPIQISVKDTSICKGDSIQLFTPFDSTYNYKWTPAVFISNDTIHNPYVYPNQTMVYTLAVKDTFDCEASRTVRIDVIDVKPEINFTNLSDCKGAMIAQLQNNTIGVEYLWTYGDGTSEKTKSNLVTHTYPKAGTYTVYLKGEKDACAFGDTITFTLEEVFLPNLVTPNADGKNDFYEIKGKAGDWHFEVYNRWGDLVYKNEAYDNKWFGDKLTDGVYYYLIISPNETRCKGWVQLLR